MLELYLKQVEFPLRGRFENERERFWNGMKSRGFVLVDGGVEDGYDNWGGERGAMWGG